MIFKNILRKTFFHDKILLFLFVMHNMIFDAIILLLLALVRVYNSIKHREKRSDISTNTKKDKRGKETKRVGHTNERNCNSKKCVCCNEMKA